MTETKEGFSDPHATHGGWRWDLESGHVMWSDAVYRIHGVSAATFDPQPDSVRELIHRDDLSRYRNSVQEAIAAQSPFTVQHRIVRPDGVIRTLVVKGSVLPGADGTPAMVVGTTEDVTERERFDDRLWFLASHDSLTGLFNRRRLLEELERELAVAHRTGRPGAILMLDLDDFKDVNDLLGHIEGDAVLTRVAEALRGRLRVTDTLARLGGDEFAVILPDCDVAAARLVGSELIDAVVSSASERISNAVREVSVSVGVAPYGGGMDRSSDNLLVHADLALYRAKARGGGCVEVFDERIRAELAERLELEGDLRDALDREALSVFYQPIVSLVDGNPIGCEALARWHHPVQGLLAADSFIPMAEERGLIGRLGESVMRTACSQGRQWRKDGHRLFVTVNVSPMQLLREDIVGMVETTLERTGLPASLLCVEVTETSVIGDVNKLLPALAGLKELGIRIALDDFGGGSSSLGFLSALPIDIIKIDRMFVEGVCDRPDDRAIVAAVISLAEELELMVIAEGIETERQQGDLRELGCRFGQGFLYSPAVEANRLQLDGYSAVVQPGVGDPSVIREFMRQIGIPAARV